MVAATILLVLALAIGLDDRGVGLSEIDRSQAGNGIATAAAARTAKVPVARCSDSIGRGVPPSRWRPDWLVAGPLGFAGLIVRGGVPVADMPEAFEPKPGKRYRVFKAGAGLRRGRKVTIKVARSERPDVMLDYVRGEKPAFVQRLKGCPHRRSGFPGGFRVTGPRCSKLRIRVHGRKRVIKRHVSFGAGECPRRSVERD